MNFQWECWQGSWFCDTGNRVSTGMMTKEMLRQTTLAGTFVLSCHWNDFYLHSISNLNQMQQPEALTQECRLEVGASSRLPVDGGDVLQPVDSDANKIDTKGLIMLSLLRLCS